MAAAELMLSNTHLLLLYHIVKGANYLQLLSPDPAHVAQELLEQQFYVSILWFAQHITYLVN